MQKETRQLAIENQRQHNVIKETKKARVLKYDKHKQASQHLQTLLRGNSELEMQSLQLMNVKHLIQCELETEQQLIEDIQSIALKYKKLLAEQRKDKEKLVQMVNNQRKIVSNLDSRKQIL